MKKIILTGCFCVLLISAAISDAQMLSSPAPPVFRVLDISERTYDGGPGIAVLFSEPLDPKVRHDSFMCISNSKGLLKSAWVLSEDCRILWFPQAEPETEYSVSVLETLCSADGHALNQRVSQTVVTRKIMPVVSFAGEGFLLPAKMSQGLPLVTVNVPSVEIEFFRLNEKALVHFVDWKNLTGRKDQYDLNHVREYGEIVFTGRFDLNAPRNRRTVSYIPVEDIRALQAPGVYLAVMREPGEYNYSYQSTYFLVTDIGLHARIYKNESVIIASSLKTGDPFFDVRLTFYDEQGRVTGEGFTDAEGCYRSPEKLPDTVYIIKAEYGDMAGILPMRSPALDMSEFDLGKRAYMPREIYVFSPRDLYRPGETVIVSALLRDYDGRPVQSLPITAKLFRPDGQEAKSFLWNEEVQGSGSEVRGQEPRTPNPEPRTGYYQTELELSKDAQTGRWSLKLWDDPSANAPCAEFEFQVEEFLPERMKLDLGVSEPQSAGTADALEIAVSGEYLYGAPASGNEVTARVRVQAKREISERFKGFQFGNIQDSTYKDYWELPSESLDNEGHRQLKIDSRWQEIQSPLSVKVIVSLFETGGRPVTRNIEQTILPAESLIGIRPLFDEKAADEGPIRFEVVRIRQDGTLSPLTSDLAPLIELKKEDRDYYWEYSESAGWKYRYSEKNYQFLTETLNLKADGPTPYTLQLQNGQYLLSVTDPETGLITSIRFRVGYWWHGRDASADASRPDRVMLKPDKPAYQPGDVIQLTVLPPSDGEGLIMVEGESLLWSKRMKVSATGTLVEIPVSARWDSHNLYISAVVFRPADAKEKITPNRAVGLIHLPLNRADRKLNLSVHAPEKAASQGPLTVTLKVNFPRSELSDSRGTSLRCTNPLPVAMSEEVFVTLAATDVGILNITDFQSPDPFAYFFEPRRYAADSYDIYGKVIETPDGRLSTLRFGGDADAGGKRPESEVRLVSLFQGPCEFDKNGEAEVTFDLPDFNGRLRLMAVAFSKNCFGSAESEVTVAAPTVTQLSMPRFLAPGDQTELTLDVHNLSGADQEFSLTMTATDPLILENGKQDFQLADGKKTTLRFPVKAGTKHAASEIRLHLESGDVTLDRDWKLGVRPGYPAIARKVRKVLNEDKTFAIDPGIAADMIPETVRADLKISPVIPLDIRNAMQDLIVYPYGCLEQTTSQAYPLLFATPDRIARYNLPQISHEERFRRLEKAVERLSSMQLISGGFGLWDKNSPENPWLTVYATEFLIAARDMGIKIPGLMDDKALNRLNEYLQQSAAMPDYGSHWDTEHLDFAVRSYAGYVLSKVNYAELGTLRILFDNHIRRAGSSLPLTHLGIALSTAGDSRRSQEALKEAAQKRSDRFGYWGDYGSLARDLAMSIALFIENKATETEGFEKLILDLEQELHQRRWLSTQEKFAIFKAGIALEGQAGKPWKGRLSIAGKETAEEHQGAYITSLLPEHIARGITFVSETSDFLYTSAIVNGYTKTPPPKDDSRISIQREMYDAEGKFIQRSDFKVGELVLVHIRIASDEWLPDALAVDLLPAGFELENQNLKHSVGFDDIQISGASVWRLKEQMNISHEEYRDDRYAAVLEIDKNRISHLFYLMRAVSPGTFSVPPTFVESMYRPEIRGIGVTPGTVRVIP